MKNKSHLYYFILLFLVLILIYIWRRQPGTYHFKGNEFNLDDTTGIQSVFIFRAGGDTTYLHKQASGWMLNNTNQASLTAVDNLLTVLKRFTIFAPVPDSDLDRVKNRIGSSGFIVRIVKSDKEIKQFTLLADTFYFPRLVALTPASSQPFLLEISGYKGNPGHFFTSNPQYWKKNMLFSFTSDEVQSVLVDYPAEPEKNFNLNLFNGVYILTSEFLNDTLYPSFQKITEYLNHFNDIPFYKSERNNEELLDSLNGVSPYVIIKISTKTGSIQLYRIFEIPVETYTDETGAKIHYDPDFLYLLEDSNPNVIKIKFIDIYPVMKTFNKF